MTSGDDLNDLILVLTTAPSPEVAAQLGRALVDERLAACVNVVPALRSIYRWKGEVCDDAEALCIVKTRRSLFATLRARLVALHPYELPEVVALATADVSHAYLEWVLASTEPSR